MSKLQPFDRPSLAVQAGGDHYKKMKLQPFDFTMHNGWDPAAHSILKYVARYRAKGTPRLDLEKSLHIIDIRTDTWGPWNYPRRSPSLRIEMSFFISENGIEGYPAAALQALDIWVSAHHRTDAREVLRSTLNVMLAEIVD